jgi:hypothetical protein
MCSNHGMASEQNRPLPLETREPNLLKRKKYKMM